MYFIANWKMFGDSKTLKSLSKVINFVKNNTKKRFKIIYCPPYTLISKMSAKFVKSSIEVGGLGAKLVGAKKAGIKKALIPKDNTFDFELLKQEGKNPEDDKFKVIIIETIYEALPYFIVKEKSE